MAARNRDLIKAALFEAVFVVLGVVLALVANEFREQYVQRRQAESALSDIVSEIEVNRDAVQQSLDYHAGLMEKIHGTRDPGWAPEASFFSRGFISPARVSRTAWDSAAQIGALSHMPYGTVLRLSEVYAQQDRYETQARTVGEIIYTEIFRNGLDSIPRNVRNLASIIATFSYREHELLGYYDRALADFGNARTDSVAPSTGP